MTLLPMTLLPTAFLLTLFLKSLLVFAAAGTLLFALRRASAAARHLVCLLTLGALLALPLFSFALPGWHLPVLSADNAVGAPLATPSTPAFSLPHSSAPQSNRQEATSQEGAASGAPTATETPAEKRPFPWLFVGIAFYAVGVVLASLRPLLGLWGIHCLSRHCTQADEEPILRTAAACASSLSLRTPRLCRAAVSVPMTWGWRRPVIVLPPASAEWPDACLRSVLLHEMAHIKRHDWPGHRLADLACAVFWFHPLVWLTARRLRAESEVACDDLVLASGVPAPDYARHLLEIASALPRVASRSQAAIAMAQTSKIESRLSMILDKTRTRRTVARRVLLAALIPAAAALVTLAVLRPDAKAQTAQPNPSTAPVLSYGFRPDISRYMAANGLPVLVGVTDANKPGSSWWSASGEVLSTPVYDTNAYHSSSSVDPGKYTVSFAFRLPANAQDNTVQYELLQSTGYSSDGFWPTKTKENTGRTEAQMFDKTSGTRVITATFLPSLTKTNLRVGIASGAWKTAAEDSIGPNPAGAAGLTGSMGIENSGAKFLFSPIVETRDGLVFSLSTDATDDLRVVAITTSGQTILPDQIGGNSIGTLDQITARFNLQRSRVKEIRVETRPFQWIEFKDVALQPVQKAGVR